MMTAARSALIRTSLAFLLISSVASCAATGAPRAKLVFGFSTNQDENAYSGAAKSGQFSVGVGCVAPVSERFVIELLDNVNDFIIAEIDSSGVVPVLLAEFSDGKYFILGENESFVDTDGKGYQIHRAASQLAIKFSRLEMERHTCPEFGMQ